jgi:hypothetical protein
MADAEPLNEEQCEEVENCLTNCEENQGKLTGWEVGFIADMRARFDKYAKFMFISERQWETLRKLSNKVDD